MNAGRFSARLQRLNMNDEFPLGAWIGFGFQIDAQATILGFGGGAGSLLGWVVSVDDPTRYICAKYSWGNTKGYHTALGISEELVTIFITSLHDPSKFFLTEPLGFEFQLDVGIAVSNATDNLNTIARQMRKVGRKNMFGLSGFKNTKVAELRFLASKIPLIDFANNLNNLEFPKTKLPTLQTIGYGLGFGAGYWNSTQAAVQIIERN